MPDLLGALLPSNMLYTLFSCRASLRSPKSLIALSLYFGTEFIGDTESLMMNYLSTRPGFMGRPPRRTRIIMMIF